jgi:hypothetical protein
MMTKPPIEKVLQGILYTENESKQKPWEDRQYQTTRKDKASESNNDSAAHNEILNP